eukprot:197887-Chlamydomonas_euryale.AAC.3
MGRMGYGRVPRLPDGSDVATPRSAKSTRKWGAARRDEARAAMKGGQETDGEITRDGDKRRRGPVSGGHHRVLKSGGSLASPHTQAREGGGAAVWCSRVVPDRRQITKEES